jgi:hypothetical protein
MFRHIGNEGSEDPKPNLTRQLLVPIREDSDREVYRKMEGEETLDDDWLDLSSPPPRTYAWKDNTSGELTIIPAPAPYVAPDIQ